MRIAAICGIASLAGGLLLLFISGLLTPGAVDLLRTGAFATDSSALLSEWHPFVHFSYNSYHAWRLDPLLVGLFPESAEAVSLVLSLLILFAGIVCLRMHTLNRSLGSAAIESAVLLLVLTVLFAADTVIFGVLCWLPWGILLLFCASSRSTKDILRYVLLPACSLLVGLRLAASANQFALYVVLVAAAITINSPRERGVQSRPAHFWICLLALMLPTALTFLQAPLLPFPDYSGSAHFVPDDGLPGHHSPMIISAYPLPVFDRALIKATLYWPAILLVIALLCMVRLRRYTLKSDFPSLLIFGGFVALIAVDVLLPEQLSQIMPLAVLQRNLPHLPFFPLSFLLLPIALLLLFATDRSRFLAPVVIAATLLTFYLVPGSGHETGARGILQHSGRLSAYQQFQDRSAKNSYNSDRRIKLLARLISPSYRVINEQGLVILERADELSSYSFDGMRRRIAEVAVSEGSRARTQWHLVDQDPRSRWSPGKGKIQGNEWLAVRFKQPFPLDGIALDTGAFHSDFPGGLKISFLENCPDLPTTADSAAGYQLIFQEDKWEGGVSFSPSGYPYYGGQGDVRIFFPQTITAQCLMIEQTGKRQYDWSVAELRFSYRHHEEAKPERTTAG